jgi:hypothetical protein
MKSKTYFMVAGWVFLLLALGHLLRAINGWEVSVGDMRPPMWISWVAVLVGGYLGYWGIKLSK